MSNSTLEPPALSQISATARSKYQQQDYRGAIGDYSLMISVEPNDARILCLRGVAYYRSGALHQAMADYNRAISIDPQLAMAYYRRGYLHFLAKEYTSAIVDYNQAIALQPDFAMAYSNRAYVYRELYGEQEALIDFRWAAKLFKEQGNLAKYQSTMDSIEWIGGTDSCASGML